MTNLRERNRLAKQRSRLKPDVRERERQFRIDNQEKIAEQVRKHQDTKWWMSLIRQARYRAKKKNLEFSISVDDLFPIPEYCPVLGIKLERVKGTIALNGSSSPSLDRIDNSKGYTKDNICIMSMRANHMKRDMSFEEVEKLYLFMKERLQ